MYFLKLKRKIKSIGNNTSIITKKFLRSLSSYFFKVLGIKFFGRSSLYIETSGKCNLACQFCAYSIKEVPQKVITIDQFISQVNQTLNMGIYDFGLTPTTGEIFLDQTIEEKLIYLNQNPRVLSYHFFSNLTAIPLKRLEKVFDIISEGKMTDFGVSIYGYNEEEFNKMTLRPNNLFKRCLINLNFLIEKKIRCGSKFKLNIYCRVLKTSSNKTIDPLLKEIKNKASQHSSISFVNADQYDNWGGLIKQESLKGISLDLLDIELVKKDGPCANIFSRPQILSDGTVIACACRDVNATLKLGNVYEDPLAKIISPTNPAFSNLVKSMDEGVFPDICRDCTAYRSLYSPNLITFRHLFSAIKKSNPLNKLYKKSINQ